METDEQSQPTQIKGRKRKVRSKQKNIRKDSRPLSAKPQHLRLGNKHYAGRPLTQETRKRLDLPPSKASLHRIISKKGIQSHNHDTAKINLDVQENLHEKDDAINQRSTSYEPRKRRKSRYKNLVNNNECS